MVKIYISTPCYDAMMTMQYTISLLKLVTFLQDKNIEFMIDFIGNESLITRARNNTLGKFLNTDSTHLFFIDSDIEFNPDAVLDLIQFNKDVVCCSYPKKTYNWNRFIYSMQNEKNSKESFDSRGLDFAYNAMLDKKGNTIQKGNFIKVNHASTGFMMIKREIIEKLNKKYPELEIITDNLAKEDSKIIGLFTCMIKNKMFLSEDYSFCQRVLDNNGEVWINIYHNLNHVGKHVFKSDIKNREYLGRNTFEKNFY